MEAVSSSHWSRSTCLGTTWWSRATTHSSPGHLSDAGSWWGAGSTGSRRRDHLRSPRASGKSSAVDHWLQSHLSATLRRTSRSSEPAPILAAPPRSSFHAHLLHASRTPGQGSAQPLDRQHMLIRRWAELGVAGRRSIPGPRHRRGAGHDAAGMAVAGRAAHTCTLRRSASPVRSSFGRPHLPGFRRTAGHGHVRRRTTSPPGSCWPRRRSTASRISTSCALCCRATTRGTEWPRTRHLVHGGPGARSLGW